MKIFYGLEFIPEKTSDRFIEVTIKETISKFHFLSGKVFKGGKLALNIQFALAMLGMEDKK